MNNTGKSFIYMISKTSDNPRAIKVTPIIFILIGRDLTCTICLPTTLLLHNKHLSVMGSHSRGFSPAYVVGPKETENYDEWVEIYTKLARMLKCSVG